jgi:glutamate N-acetyltransferase/amino-acid N-acetyltransferase
MKSICGIRGVTCHGMKEGKFGLALIRASGTAAGVFTGNLVRAAPVTLMEERIRKGRLEAVMVNSGCANAYTGGKGYQDAVSMAEIGAGCLGVDPSAVGIASTGVIGRYLDLPLIKAQCTALTPQISGSEESETLTARAIMTTDTFEKHALVESEGFSVGGICKGSGMIAPNMGTMIACIYTDAEVRPKKLREALKDATRRSFNRVVVDGDTSTNDVAFLVATGENGKAPGKEFAAALQECCRNLAVQIATDGEGATKLLEVTVRGAPDEEKAANVARTIIGSPLVKTAIYGEDPNWGRIIAAAGRAGVEFDPSRVSMLMGGDRADIPVFKKGEIVVDLARAKAAMAGKKVTVDLDLLSGKGKATAWGCDLTEKYVEINGRYTT